MAKSGFGAAKEAVEQSQQQQAGKNQEYEKFSAGKGEEPAKRVRFLVMDGDDSVITFLEHWTEFNNTWKRNFACPNEEMGDDNCVVCRGKRGTDYVKDQRKNAHFINLIDRTDNVRKAWKFSPMAMAALLEHLHTNGNISDRDYTVQFIEDKDENTKVKFAYAITPATDTPVEMSKGDKELAETRYNLKTLVPPYNGDNLASVMAMKPKEEEKKGTTAASFLQGITGNSGGPGPQGSIVDQFKTIVDSKAGAAPASAEESSAADEFKALLKVMNSTE